jgi:hypothetical protein
MSPLYHQIRSEKLNPFIKAGGRKLYPLTRGREEEAITPLSWKASDWRSRPDIVGIRDRKRDLISPWLIGVEPSFM